MMMMMAESKGLQAGPREKLRGVRLLWLSWWLSAVGEVQVCPRRSRSLSLSLSLTVCVSLSGARPRRVSGQSGVGG